MQVLTEEDHQMESGDWPVRCYQKGRLRDRYGQERDWPYLMSLSEFRATSDYAGILDWFSEWNGKALWMWRVTGRFHDD
jgi:hypothetical protein